MTTRQIAVYVPKIQCDHHGCLQSFPRNIVSVLSVADVRELAKEFGWTHTLSDPIDDPMDWYYGVRFDRDWCPVHS